MPEDKSKNTNPNPDQSGGSAVAAPEKPKIDTSVLNEEKKQFDSAAVNLASPEDEKFSKYNNNNETPEVGKDTDASATPVNTETETSTDTSQTEPVYQSAPPPPPANSDLPPVEPNGSKKPVIVVLVVLLLLALIGGGVWWYMNSQTADNEITEQPAPVPTPDLDPEPEEPSEPQVTVDSQTTENFNPTVTGTIDNSDATVTVVIDGTEYEATVNPDGTWSADVSNDLPAGTYDVMVVAETADGATATEEAAGALIVSTPAPEPTPEPEPEPEPEPDTTPTTGPNDSLPITGPAS